MRWVVLLMAACGQPPAPKPIATPTPTATHAQAGAQSAVGFDRGLDLAFDNAPPAFAYIRGDEVLVFDYDRSAIDGQPRRSEYVRYRIGRPKAIERLPLIDDALWRTWVEPPPPSTIAKLHERAVAVSAAIRGMTALPRFSDWTNHPVSVGRMTVSPRTDRPVFEIEVVDGDNKYVAQEQIRAFDTKQHRQEDEAWLPCTYAPSEMAVYSDTKQLLVLVRYHYSIDCDDRDHAVRLWQLK